MNPPLTIADLRAFRAKLMLGEVTAAEIRPMWERLSESEAALTAEFTAMKKDELAKWVSYHSRGENKAHMVRQSMDTLRGIFVADSMVSYSMGETYAIGVERQLSKWTDELIQNKSAERKAETAAQMKAITTPETLDEFEKFIEHHSRRKLTPEQIAHANGLAKTNLPAVRAYLREIGISRLTPEQKVRYETLHAEQTKGQRLNQTIQRKTVDEGQLPEGVTMSVTETKHTLKGHALWVVRLSDRVDSEVFQMLNIRAKKIGGYYSSFARNGAIPGFQFDDAGKAERFKSMERIDGEIRVQEIKEVRQERAEERLTNIGETLQERGEDKLNQERKENTARRAGMAASAEADARRTIAVGTTAVNLAGVVGSGQAKFLDRLYNATQVESLHNLLRSAQYQRIQATIPDTNYSDRENARSEAPGIQDAGYAKYPWPYVHTSNLEQLIREAEHTPGAKLVAGRVGKMIAHKGRPETIRLENETEREQVRELASKLARRGNSTGRHIRGAFEGFDRLWRMDIRTEPELRSALREYAEYRAEVAKADPLKQAERELIGTKIPGFFPTPGALAAELVEKAGIESGMRVLEPSAGKGDLVDAIRATEPGAQVDVVEYNSRLIELLEKKGHTLAHKGDFLSYNPGAIYDRIVMNPPFEDGQDIKHVEHAYTLLKPGGRLVAIMSEGPFFRADRQAQGFRALVDSNGGISEKNAEGAFAGSDAFRQTGTATRMLVLDRAAERQQLEIAVEQPAQVQESAMAAAI